MAIPGIPASRKRKPYFERLKVSPQLAREWLELNTHNRPLKKSIVQQYAHEMKTGQWDAWTNQSIAFDTDGVLRDGQHRLRAIVAADTPVDCWVYLNMPPESTTSIDIGKGRTLADRMESAERITSLIRFCHVFINGNPTLKATPKEAQAIYNKNPKGIEWASGLQYKTGIPQATCAAIRYAFAEYWQRSPSHAEDFREQFYSGIGCVRNSPALALRSFLITAAKRTELNRKARYLAATAAMAAHENDDPLSKIHISDDMRQANKRSARKMSYDMKLDELSRLRGAGKTVTEIAELMQMSQVWVTSTMRKLGLLGDRELKRRQYIGMILGGWTDSQINTLPGFSDKTSWGMRNKAKGHHVITDEERASIEPIPVPEGFASADESLGVQENLL